ncbi:NAD(P)-dependent oxidoreductase [Streptomyces physcomitrii]|uniref:NAD-dependent epimerase/dehydratase family protein n=1 Tax=Streptomyces physcomitrii TaxID=2724184 RepID=UPI00341CDBE9
MAPSHYRRAVVIGGTGFLGRHICTALAAQGHDVLAIARKAADPIPRTAFTALDILTADDTEISAALSGAELVINAAGDAWQGDEAAMAASHQPLVQRLVDTLAAHAHRPRLIHLGSVHEYGPLTPPHPVTEDHTPAPGTVYARTKLAASTHLLDATEAGRVDGCVLRVTNVCGPGLPPGSFLGHLTRQLRRTQQTRQPLSLTLADDQRDYIDVRDVATAVLHAATAPVTGRVLNIGQGHPTPIRELAHQLIALSGLPPHLIHTRTAPLTSNGSGWTSVDTGLATRLLDWTPRISLEQSLHDQWATPTEATAEAGSAAPATPTKPAGPASRGEPVPSSDEGH